MKRRSLLLSVLPLVFGMLAALPLVIESLPLLSFIGWCPFAYYLKARLADASFTRGRAYLSVLFFFMGYFMLSFSFFIAMYPLDFAGLSNVASVAVLFAAMVLLPLFQATPIALSALLLRFLAKARAFRFPAAFSLFFASSVSFLFYLQNFTWAGVPWATPAIGLTFSPFLIQSASVFGSAFLTFLILFINALLAEGYDAFRRCQDKHALLASLLAFVLFFGNLGAGALLYHQENTDTRTVKVALIQGCAPISEYYTQASLLNTCRYLAREAAEEGADIMLWSETTLEYAIEKDESKPLFFASIAEETGAIQVVGSFSIPEGEDAYYNALLVFYPDGTQSEEAYYKRRPVPFGEYLPMAELFRIILPALTEINMLSRDVDPGTDTNLFHFDEFTAGGLICFDSIYPALARESVKDGADLLLIPTNDSWFDGSFGKALHRSHAILRAVENGTPVARTGNTGYSVLINDKGEIVASAIPDESDYVVDTLSLTSKTTPYTVMGDLFIWLCLCYLVFCPAIIFIYDKQKQRKELL